jgi:hypothetical protein
LKEAATGLEATLRVRRRVVSELAADLEDLYGAYRAEGLPAGEARRRAERVLAPSPEVLAALSRMHRPVWVRLGDRFGEKGRHRVEWAILVALTTGFCALSVVLLLRASMAPAPVPFAVAILLVAFASLLYALGSGLARYLGRWPRPEGGRVDVKVLAAAAAAVLVLSGLGALVGLWRVAAAISARGTGGAALGAGGGRPGRARPGGRAGGRACAAGPAPERERVGGSGAAVERIDLGRAAHYRGNVDGDRLRRNTRC